MESPSASGERKALDYLLQAGDRIEFYGHQFDPKEARRARAKKPSWRLYHLVFRPDV